MLGGLGQWLGLGGGGGDAADGHGGGADTATTEGRSLYLRPNGEPPAVHVKGGPFASAGSTFTALSAGPVEGYRQFVDEYALPLEQYASVRNENMAIRLLVDWYTLVEGIAHVRQWFFLRHVDMCRAPDRVVAPSKAGTKGIGFSLPSADMTLIHEEAAAFFLLDLAADAARAQQPLEGSNARSPVGAHGVALSAAGQALVPPPPSTLLHHPPPSLPPSLPSSSPSLPPTRRPARPRRHVLQA